ncbi:MAG: FAD:protein FMN transferase [Oscillospiraceae bacterium]|jgi:thiamine biosynthesis lipoprotein|nr:FAD:protein FMN transferase [Oscillospiraceae bacterium]
MKKLLLLALVLLLSACAQPEPAQSDLFAMDTIINVKIWGNEAEDALHAVTQKINDSSARFSVTTEGSELYLLNQDGSAALSEDFSSLLAQAVSLSERTGGAFDPTVYPLVRLWGFTAQEYHVPNAYELEQTLQLCGLQKLHLFGANATLGAGAMLDLGAIAKGWTGQHCAELLESYNIDAALLALGGNVQTVGTKPDGSAWVIGIANPETPSEAIATLRFTGSRAVVTSGSYQRYFEEDGIAYHHILNPQSGLPAQSGLLSVTVIADDGTLADALSTALFVMGLDDATAFWRESDDFEAVFITDSGEIFASEGAASLLSDCVFTVIAR